jgi:hypothetical protein
MNEVISDSVAQERFTMILLCGFGLISLVLDAAGLYGVMSYNVARQTQEIGVRMALDARREDVAGMVLKDASSLVRIGLVIGIAASLLGEGCWQPAVWRQAAGSSDAGGSLGGAVVDETFCGMVACAEGGTRRPDGSVAERMTLDQNETLTACSAALTIPAGCAASTTSTRDAPTGNLRI